MMMAMRIIAMVPTLNQSVILSSGLNQIFLKLKISRLKLVVNLKTLMTMMTYRLTVCVLLAPLAG